MDALEYSILRVTRHSDRPVQKVEIYAAIRKQQDRLPIHYPVRAAIDDRIDDLHDRGLLESQIVSPDGQRLQIGFTITDDGEQRLLELADNL